ncbi:hypothetical protein D3C80_2006380 [compost metagenome]
MMLTASPTWPRIMAQWLLPSLRTPVAKPCLWVARTQVSWMLVMMIQVPRPMPSAAQGLNSPAKSCGSSRAAARLSPRASTTLPLSSPSS